MKTKQETRNSNQKHLKQKDLMSKTIKIEVIAYRNPHHCSITYLKSHQESKFKSQAHLIVQPHCQENGSSVCVCIREKQLRIDSSYTYAIFK